MYKKLGASLRVTKQRLLGQADTVLNEKGTMC